MRIPALLLAGLCLSALCLAERPAPPSSAEDPLARITAAHLRGDLSFLASDALEGRGTPSRGLDLAAEFIGSRFRAAGLQPIFQRAKFSEVRARLDDFKLSLSTAQGELDLTGAEVRVLSVDPVSLTDGQVVRLPDNGVIPDVKGRIVAGEYRRYGREAMLRLLQTRHPAVILLFSKTRFRGPASSWLADLESHAAPVFSIANDDAMESFTARQPMKVSVRLAAPERHDAVVSNVAAIVTGSDPALKDQYVLVTAHYDHLGLKKDGEGDRIYNGANDDGSGTVSMIELAGAVAAMPVRPRRSILFMAFFGEEEGLLGSFYYADHPLVPLAQTVANINLEQMGRTDDTQGPELSAFAFTGTSYSDLPATMRQAAESEGVKVFTSKSSDEYFARSDNYAFALAGIVAHTVVVAFDYPDYHAVADEWPKIDFENMAKVDRGVGAGILAIANADAAPRWSDNKEAAPYREAAR